MLTLFTSWLPRRRTPATGPDTSADTRARTAGSSIGGTASRKQMLAVVLRETLLRNNLPSTCIGMEFFRTTERAGPRTNGIHVRLLVREAHPELPQSMLALERDFRRRLVLVDYRAPEWLQGVSWQFDLPDALPGGEVAGRARQPVLLQEGTRGFPRTFTSTEPAPL